MIRGPRAGEVAQTQSDPEELGEGLASAHAEALEQPPSDGGSTVLGELASFLSKFVAYPTEAALVAHTLWIAHAHAMDAWESTPRLAFLSPEPASGKTRALEVTELLVPSPVQSVNVTPAYLFRKVGSENDRSTVLFDEIDTVFGPKAKANEELRGLLNAGHRRGAVAGRCVVRSKSIETEEIPAFCAVALAGLGGLPDTLLSRSIVIRMRRRRREEAVEPFRRSRETKRGHEIRDALASWVGSQLRELKLARPSMPMGVEDRAADCWESLLSVADAAGGAWPERARAASVALVAESQDKTISLGVRLLADLRRILRDAEFLATAEVLGRLNGLDEAPWGDLRGRPLDARGLSNLLRPYGVAPRQRRAGSQVLRGYSASDLFDAFARYLPALSIGDPKRQMPERSATAVTAATAARPESVPVVDLTARGIPEDELFSLAE